MGKSNITQSFADWAFTQRMDDVQAAALYRRAKEIGYAAVELAPPARWDAARKAGLALLNIPGVGMADGMNRVDLHEGLTKQTEDLITTAAENKIAQIVVFSGNRTDETDEIGRKNVIKALKPLAGFAERAGVVLTLELFGQVAHPGYQADTIAYGADVVRAVGSPSLKILYDLYHMHTMGVDVAREVIDHLDLIAHLHIAGEVGRAFPDPNGPIDYARIVPAIVKAGYRGMWGHEYMVKSTADRELAESFELFEKYAR